MPEYRTSPSYAGAAGADSFTPAPAVPVGGTSRCPARTSSAQQPVITTVQGLTAPGRADGQRRASRSRPDRRIVRYALGGNPFFDNGSSEGRAQLRRLAPVGRLERRHPRLACRGTSRRPTWSRTRSAQVATQLVNRYCSSRCTDSAARIATSARVRPERAAACGTTLSPTPSRAIAITGAPNSQFDPALAKQQPRADQLVVPERLTGPQTTTLVLDAVLSGQTG